MRLDDDGLNINPEVAELLGYARPRPPRRAQARGSALDAVGDIVGWIVSGFIGLVFGFIGLTVAVILPGVTGFIVSAARGPAPLSATATSNNPHTKEMTSSIARVNERPILSQLAAEPPVETYGEATPSVPEPQQISTGTTVATFVWHCQKMTCGLWNGREYVQWYTLYERGIVTTSILSQIHPPAWGCEASGVQLYCTIQDSQGLVLQSCLYDGRSLNCRNPAHVPSGSQEEAHLGETRDIAVPASFPSGWYYVRFERPLGLHGSGCPPTLPSQTPVFVSGRTTNGYRLVLSEDGNRAC
jgi:hypothetical protein